MSIGLLKIDPADVCTIGIVLRRIDRRRGKRAGRKKQ